MITMHLLDMNKSKITSIRTFITKHSKDNIKEFKTQTKPRSAAIIVIAG